jgi:hypothetical protein
MMTPMEIARAVGSLESALQGAIEEIAEHQASGSTHITSPRTLARWRAYLYDVEHNQPIGTTAPFYRSAAA